MGVNVSTVMVVVALVAGLWWGFSRRRRRALLGVFSIAALALAVATLVIDGVLYSTAGDRRDVVALDAATGELLWTHREDEGRRAQVSPRRLSGRGLAYWASGGTVSRGSPAFPRPARESRRHRIAGVRDDTQNIVLLRARVNGSDG